jgi:hypothetical protein
MILFAILVAIGFLSAVLLAAAYWFILRALEPALNALRRKFHHRFGQAPAQVPCTANELLYLDAGFQQSLRASSGLQFAAVLVVGAASVSLLSNSQVPCGSNLILTETNAWHVS